MAARVTVVVPCVCVCVCVCMCVHSNLLPHTLESQKRDTNGFIAKSCAVCRFTSALLAFANKGTQLKSFKLHSNIMLT